MTIIHRKGVLLDGIGAEYVRATSGGLRKTLSAWVNLIANLSGQISAAWASVIQSASLAAGQALIDAGNPFTDVASAATVDLGAVASNKVRITGTTGPITSFGTAAAGVTKRVRIASTPSITYNATSMILPGDANIACAADDEFDAVSLGSGNWYVGRFNYGDNPFRRVSSTQVSLYSNGGTVEALRIYDASGSFRLGTPTGINTAFPEFEFVKGGVGQPKFFTRTIFLADPGDTPDINLQAVGGDYTTYSAVFQYHLGGFLRGLHYDGTSASPVSGITAPVDGEVAGSYPYNGSAGQIAFPNMQTPTQANRGGGVLINSTPLNMAATIQRIFVHPSGGTVFFGRSTWEDSGASYPWQISNRNHWDRDALGAHNYSNTTPTGILHVIATDRANLAALSVRKYNAQTTGFDLSYIDASDKLTLDKITSGTRTRAIDITNSSGLILLGFATDAGNATAGFEPVASQVNRFNFKGSVTGSKIELEAVGDDSNIGIRIVPKGTAKFQVDNPLDLSNSTAGQIEFPATQNPSSNANTLDDYEEGTWTPALTFETPGDLSVAYSAQAGTYTKIGRMVQITCAITTSTFTHTTASGNLLITGIPFNAGADCACGIGRIGGVTKANYTHFGANFGASNAFVNFFASGSGQAPAVLAVADMPTGGTVRISFSMTYNV